MMNERQVVTANRTYTRKRTGFTIRLHNEQTTRACGLSLHVCGGLFFSWVENGTGKWVQCYTWVMARHLMRNWLNGVTYVPMATPPLPEPVPQKRPYHKGRDYYKSKRRKYE